MIKPRLIKVFWSIGIPLLVVIARLVQFFAQYNSLLDTFYRDDPCLRYIPGSLNHTCSALHLSVPN